MTRVNAPDSRILHLLTALSAAFLIVGAYFLEERLGLKPCPICISQRLVVAIVALSALLAFVHRPDRQGKRVYGLIFMAAGLCGCALSIRQLYLQSLPPESAPACMPDLSYLVDILPLSELAMVMLSGTGDCAEVQWRFMGLSIPGWTLLFCIGYALVGLMEMVRKHPLRTEQTLMR